MERTTRRADARRNHDRLVAVASEVIAQQGAEASLEEIARRAGVGSATLHRHFPTRQALLEAVFRERVEHLGALGQELLDERDAGRALVSWLGAVVAHAAATRGMGTALLAGLLSPELGSSAHAVIGSTGAALLDRARQAGAIRPAVAVADVLQLVNAIAIATEHSPEPAEQAERLLALVVDGLRTGSP
jgi:AcrR family transcriptional regulator